MDTKDKEEGPLVKGGQGRSAESLIESAKAAFWSGTAAAIALVLYAILQIWSLFQ